MPLRSTRRKIIKSELFFSTSYASFKSLLAATFFLDLLIIWQKKTAISGNDDDLTCRTKVLFSLHAPACREPVRHHHDGRVQDTLVGRGTGPFPATRRPGCQIRTKFSLKEWRVSELFLRVSSCCISRGALGVCNRKSNP
jgi:hypothetical protein